MANNPYVNKVVFGNNTVMDISGDTATPSDVLKGETFHDKSGASQVGTLSLDEFATIDLLKDTVGWIGKNLLKLHLTSGSTNGVNYTVNVDGSISLSGTATNDAYLTLHSRLNDPIELESDNYILNGCPANGGGSTYQLYFAKSDGSSITDYFYDNGNGVSFSYDGQYNYTVNILVKSGQNVDGKVFYPMIRKASITDDTYESYHESVEQCKFDRAEQRVLGAKNLIDVRNNSATMNGVTITRQSDNSYIINGTCNATSTNIRIDQTTASGVDNLKSYNGQYTLTLLDANGNYVPNTRAVLMQNTTWTYGLEAKADNNGKDVGYVNLNDCFIFLGVYNGITYNNVRVYPMLRLASDPDDTYAPYAMTNKELTDSLDGWTATSQVANEQVTFTGLDDTQGWGYDPRIWIDDNSTNLNPYCKINSITGAGTANMSITYDTDADNGAYVRLRIIK